VRDWGLFASLLPIASCHGPLCDEPVGFDERERFQVTILGSQSAQERHCAPLEPGDSFVLVAGTLVPAYDNWDCETRGAVGPLPFPLNWSVVCEPDDEQLGMECWTPPSASCELHVKFHTEPAIRGSDSVVEGSFRFTASGDCTGCSEWFDVRIERLEPL